MKLPPVKKWRDVKRVFAEYGIETVETAAPDNGVSDAEFYSKF